ncbi:MAG: Inositol 2-dehydrogenase/D-chiro-inositol 3-dehydrogenase [bacterium]|nr:Inositol 2-dehydrogenase/D-chiro-inositol 3-dehydrogenase [bacterium]
MTEVTRRDFVKGAAVVGAGAAVGLGALKRSTASWAGANERVRVAVIGINGRGKSHLGGFTKQENVEVATICDVDERLFAPRIKDFFTSKGLKEPKTEFDLRRVMEDKDIHAVSIATPNHWHSLAAIWACQAGKDVYVEKPCSHNVWEGRKLVEAANKYGRMVQHGTQIRSNPGVIEGIQKLQEGVIGEVYMARGLCYKWRPSIDKTPDEPAPEGVHYDIWLGPAPTRAYSKNRLHYNWHWHWDYGNGDIGNQGVHQYDVARWGLGVTLPKTIISAGGQYLWDDDKEVPNVMNCTMLFPDAGKKGKMLVFDVRPWITNDEAGVGVGNIFYGSEGIMTMDSYEGYKTFLGQGREPGPTRYEGADHYGNFIAAVRTRDKKFLTAPPEEAHLSSALCHLANISYRVGRNLEFDAAAERFVGDEEADKLLTRDYRAPYTVPAVV